MAPGHSSQKLLIAFTQPVVREIVHLLANGEADVTSIAERLELDKSTISRALARLRSEDIVTYRRKWRRHIYSLTERVRFEATESDEQIEVTGRSGERILLSSLKTRLGGPSSHLSIVTNDK